MIIIQHKNQFVNTFFIFFNFLLTFGFIGVNIYKQKEVEQCSFSPQGNCVPTVNIVIILFWYGQNISETGIYARFFVFILLLEVRGY